MQTTFIPAEDAIERKAQRELMKYATGRAIFCPCGRVLDMRSSAIVAITVTGQAHSTKVFCEKCFAGATFEGVVRQFGATVEVDTLKGTTVYAPESDPEEVSNA